MRKLVVLACWLFIDQVAGQAAESCLSDVTKCLPEFRNRYLDIDYYWFGTPYATMCPGIPFCVNINPDLQSVISRVLWNTNTTMQQEAVANMRILNVTFEQPARSYYACDTWNKVPSTPPVQINPLEPTMLSQLTTQNRPHVTWTPRTRESLYTVAMMDLSYMFLHTFYINCANGTMANGEAVQLWQGTALVYFVNGPYVFLVYEQGDRIPLQTAQQALQETRDEGSGASALGIFRVNRLIEKLSNFLDTAIQFSAIMEMYTDPYGSSLATNYMGMADICPLFYSQLTTFHSAVQSMQIPDPKWSPPAFSFSQLSNNSQLTSLTVNLKVTYDTDDYMDNACCKQFTRPKGSYAISPLDATPVPAVMTRNKPRVFLTPVFMASEGQGRAAIANASQIYTLLMVDVTPALTSSDPGPKLVFHWLVANIFASNFDTGTEVAPYFSPNSMNEKQNHTYMFLLFQQSSVVDPSTLGRLCPSGLKRCELKITDLIRTWRLGEIVGVSWFQSKFDSFALKQLYTEFAQSEEKVCKGREGYSSPCNESPQLGFSSQALILTIFVVLLNYVKTT